MTSVRIGTRVACRIVTLVIVLSAAGIVAAAPAEASVPTPRQAQAMAFFQAVGESTGHVYMFGGRDGNQILDDFEYYDATINDWMPAPSGPCGRVASRMTYIN